MNANLTKIERQIAQLKAQAEAMRKNEASPVLAFVRQAVQAYGFTYLDVFEADTKSTNNGRHDAKRVAGYAKSGPKAKTKSKYTTKAKFKDEAGNTWVGRGPRPHWLQEALKSGKTLDEFRV